MVHAAVRDLAEAHYRAGFRPEASGRYIISGHSSDMTEVAAVLRPQFGDSYPIPSRILPKWLVWLVGPMTNKLLTRKIVQLNVGLPWWADNGKGVRELGMTYRPLEETGIDFFQQMIDVGEFDESGPGS